ncbi:MAG TPA: DNA repair protein RadC [Acidimicrobiia bacterium]|nr:DNA repair protein RadC [Acidimicrobiia bacterium]
MTVPMAAVPPHERPRERLLSRGAEALNERELLALVLRSGAPGLSALDLAAELLAEYGSLNRLASAEPEEMANRRGIGAAKAAALVAAFQLANRAEVEPAVPVVLRTAEDVAGVARREIGRARRERVLVLICDGGNRLLRTVIVSEGSIDRSMVPVREILNAVLRHDGRGFALAHNHPNGDSRPSDADERATQAVRTAATSVGLRFFGHVVTAGTEFESCH